MNKYIKQFFFFTHVRPLECCEQKCLTYGELVGNSSVRKKKKIYLCTHVIYLSALEFFYNS